MAHGIAYRRNASSEAEALVPVRVSSFTYVLAHTPSMQHAYMHTYMHTAGTLSIGTSRTALRAGGCRSTCAGESFEFHICTCTFPKHGARIHAYMQTCIHTYIHTYVHLPTHTYGMRSACWQTYADMYSCNLLSEWARTQNEDRQKLITTNTCTFKSRPRYLNKLCNTM